MRNAFAAAVLAALVFPTLAHATEVSDQTQAIRLCRTEVAAQAGTDLDAVRLDQIQVRSRAIRVHLDLWRNGQLENVRCDVTRGDHVQVAQITPALRAIAENR